MDEAGLPRPVKIAGSARGWQFLRGAIGAVSRQDAGFAAGSGFA